MFLFKHKHFFQVLVLLAKSYSYSFPDETQWCFISATEKCRQSIWTKSLKWIIHLICLRSFLLFSKQLSPSDCWFTRSSSKRKQIPCNLILSTNMSAKGSLKRDFTGLTKNYLFLFIGHYIFSNKTLYPRMLDVGNFKLQTWAKYIYTTFSIKICLYR
jgi:hypothetical protein